MNNGSREKPQDYIEKKSDKNKQPNQSTQDKPKNSDHGKSIQDHPERQNTG